MMGHPFMVPVEVERDRRVIAYLVGLVQGVAVTAACAFVQLATFN